MNLREWNEALFRGVVQSVGRPGDPLYFYVDDTTLSHISGIEDPEEAVRDFTRAFEAISFKQSAREAVMWRHHGYEGVPVFLSAMAITVLAVTLEPIGGNTNNVYRRQNELLGKAGRSKPEGYEAMSNIWSVWNDYLQSPEGRQYGTPTARTNNTYTHQGWARSQGFIRFEDKQDIYIFLDEESPQIADSASGRQLVRRLGNWLSAQGSRSRLARMCNNKAVEDELGAILVSARNFWEEERDIRLAGAELTAVPLLESFGGGLHLVVPLTGMEGTQGATISDLDLEEYTLEAGEKYAFLTNPYIDASSWLREPITEHRLNDSWTVTWEPPEDGVYLFSEDADEDVWVGVKAPSPSTDAKILVDVGYQPDILERLAAKLGRSDLQLGLRDSETERFAWITADGDTVVPGPVAARLLGQESRGRRERNHALHGGLRFTGNTFLNGFEPDIRISADAMAPAYAANQAPKILVDGVDLGRHLEVKEDGGAHLSLADQFLHPGEHAITVQIGNQKNTSNITSRPAAAPALFPQVKRRHRHEHIVRFSLERSPNPMVFVIPEDGDLMRVDFSGRLRSWLLALENSDPNTPRFESFFDSSWFEWLVHPSTEENEQLLVAARSADNGPWQILRRQGNLQTLANSGRVSQVSPLTPWELLALFGSGARYDYVDEDARLAFSKKRREHSTVNQDFFRHRKDGARKSPGLAAPPPRNWRKDTDGWEGGNPYEYLLWWLTEKGDSGVLSSTAEAAFKWLCERTKIPEVPDFNKVIYDLEALGHVARDKGRIHVLPASANWLPDSEALIAISGARGEEMVGVLESGGSMDDREQEAALFAIDSHVFTQTRPLGPNSSLRVPAAPRTVYAQLGSRSRSPSKQAHILGFEFYDPSLDELEAFPTLEQSLTNPDRAMTLRDLNGKIDLFTPTKRAPGGRWRRLSTGLANLDEDAFLRVLSSMGRRYMWWSKEKGSLVDCGWIWGLWGFHRNTETDRLIGHNQGRDLFAVKRYMLFPRDLERFLVMRSGLLPRTATSKPRGRRGGQDSSLWRVYSNISAGVAALVSSKMGHPWGKSPDSSPASLQDLEFQ